MPSRSTLISIVLGGASASFLGFSDKAEPVRRFSATAGLAIHTFLDYEFSLRGLKKNSEEYSRARDDAHTRGAKRLLDLCRHHGGIFTKVGQHIASLTHILPRQYTSKLALLQDSAAPRPYSSVEEIFRQDMNCLPTDVFDEFERTPIAAASLAQVHVARLKGKQVAVKVQYPKLYDLFQSDLNTIKLMARIASYVIPRMDLEWIVHTFEENLTRELDFQREATSAERTANNFSLSSSVTTPAIVWPLTSKRILVMDFIDGCRVDDVLAIKKMGFHPRRIASLVSEAFGEMIFQHGFVHCDPHPGNIYVRPHPQQPHIPQLVLLDNGLYQTISDSFRLNYCYLWRACITLNEKELKLRCNNLGVGKYFAIFPLMFTFRTLHRTSVLGDIPNRHEIRKQLDIIVGKRNGAVHIGDVSSFLEDLPRPMLLLLKTQNLIRALNKSLGGSTADRLQSLVKQAVRGSYVQSSISSSSDYTSAVYEAQAFNCYRIHSNLSRPLRAAWNSMSMYFELLLLDVSVWLVDVSIRLSKILRHLHHHTRSHYQLR